MMDMRRSYCRAAAGGKRSLVMNKVPVTKLKTDEATDLHKLFSII